MSLDDRARALLARHPIIDGHNDLPFEMRERTFYDLDAYPVDRRQSATQTDLVRLAEGGVGGQFWSVFVPSSWAGEQAVAATLEQIDFVHRMIERYPDRLRLARNAAEVDTAFAAGRIASLIGAEGGHSIDSSLGVLRMLHALGVRYMTLTHNDNTPWADSATDQPAHGGLTDFGRDVVREMNRIGVLVDLSHVAPSTMRDALAVASVPAIFSHSSARALVDHVRNVPDDVLGALTTNGGVCMATFVPAFVSDGCRVWQQSVLDDLTASGADPRDWSAVMAASKKRAETEPPPVATVAQVADHVEHIREVAGIDHVGIGGDFDGIEEVVLGLEDVSTYPRLFAELARRGWSDEDMAKLAGGNVLRVFEEAERVAARLRRTRSPSTKTIEELDGR